LRAHLKKAPRKRGGRGGGRVGVNLALREGNIKPRLRLCFGVQIKGCHWEGSTLYEGGRERINFILQRKRGGNGKVRTTSVLGNVGRRYYTLEMKRESDREDLGRDVEEESRARRGYRDSKKGTRKGGNHNKTKTQQY